MAYCRADLERVKTFKWQKYTYRHYNEASVQQFKEWVVMHDWQEVLSAGGSNDKANAYQRTITKALDEFFPKKTTRKKSTDLPWMNKRIEKLIKNRKLLYYPVSYTHLTLPTTPYV